MADPLNRVQTHELMRRHGIRPTHSLGQNFLVDASALTSIVAAAELGSGDLVLEIGPGLGHLTRLMAAQASRVIAIEIDRHLLPALEETTAGLENLEIIHADAQAVNLTRLIQSWSGPHKLVANLPYYITTPLLMKALTEWPSADRMVLTIQDEAADRILATPGQGAYGPLAILCQLYGQLVRQRIIPADAFIPRPHVASCLLVMTGRPDRPDPVEWPPLVRFLTASFVNRRKKLINVLHSHLSAKRTKEEVQVAFDQLSLSANARAEELSPEQWLRLFRLLR